MFTDQHFVYWAGADKTPPTSIMVTMTLYMFNNRGRQGCYGGMKITHTRELVKTRNLYLQINPLPLSKKGQSTTHEKGDRRTMSTYKRMNTLNPVPNYIWII